MQPVQCVAGDAHNRNCRATPKVSAAFGEVKRDAARTAGRVIDMCRSAAAASVVVSVPPVYIYTSRRATVSGHRLVVGVAARMMTRLLGPSLVSIAIIRRKSEEWLAAGARKRT